VSRRAGALALALTFAAAGPARGADEGGPWTCADHAELVRGSVVVQNNVWNKGTTTDYEQCVRALPGGVAEWRWRWPPAGDEMPEAYPEVVFGRKPWRDGSTTEALPVRLADLRTLTVDLALGTGGDGAHNLAFDVWLTRTAAATPDTIAVEVMLWLDRRGMRAAGERVADLDVDGAAADLFRWDAPGWRYLALVRREPIREGRFDLLALLHALEARGELPRGLFVASVELGNEVAGGQGWTRLHRFDVRVEAAPAGPEEP
jgi:hypothetical protein